MEISANSNLAMTYLKQKKYRKAIEYCEIVLDKDESNKKAKFRLGLAYKNLGDFEKGLNVLEGEFGEEFENLKREIRTEQNKTQKEVSKMLKGYEA